jgi:hypothetical protein
MHYTKITREQKDYQVSTQIFVRRIFDKRTREVLSGTMIVDMTITILFSVNSDVINLKWLHFFSLQGTGMKDSINHM